MHQPPHARFVSDEQTHLLPEQVVHDLPHERVGGRRAAQNVGAVADERGEHVGQPFGGENFVAACEHGGHLRGIQRAGVPFHFLGNSGQDDGNRGLAAAFFVFCPAFVLLFDQRFEVCADQLDWGDEQHGLIFARRGLDVHGERQRVLQRGKHRRVFRDEQAVQTERFADGRLFQRQQRKAGEVRIRQRIARCEHEAHAVQRGKRLNFAQQRAGIARRLVQPIQQQADARRAVCARGSLQNLHQRMPCIRQMRVFRVKFQLFQNAVDDVLPVFVAPAVQREIQHGGVLRAVRPLLRQREEQQRRRFARAAAAGKKDMPLQRCDFGNRGRMPFFILHAQREERAGFQIGQRLVLLDDGLNALFSGFPERPMRHAAPLDAGKQLFKRLRHRVGARIAFFGERKERKQEDRPHHIQHGLRLIRQKRTFQPFQKTGSRHVVRVRRLAGQLFEKHRADGV